MKISVLIPCYNQEVFIEKTVQAVIEQTRPADEIIIVDDGSTDHSAEILARLPVKVVSHASNRGLSQARNTALLAAQGEIVLYIDSDAYADQRLIEVLLQAYKTNPDPRLAGIGGRGIEVNNQSAPDRWRSLHSAQNYGDKPRQRVDFIYGLCMSFKRPILLEVGGFDPFFVSNAEDFNLGWRLRQAGYTLEYEPGAIVYHQRSDSEEKLKKTQANWVYWGYLAYQRADGRSWKMYAGTLRRLFTDTLPDLLRGDIELVRLDLQMFSIKMSALRKAAQDARRIQFPPQPRPLKEKKDEVNSGEKLNKS